VIHSEDAEEFNVLHPDTLFYAMVLDLMGHLNIAISDRLLRYMQDTRIFTVTEINLLTLTLLVQTNIYPKTL
jgi:hypothetical protein